MIVDLRKDALPPLPEDAVCIIGAGIVGLSLACRLRELGSPVILLERGGPYPSQANVAKGIEKTKTQYSGAHKGRAFGLGGTSGLWGGQLAAATTDERLARPWVGMPPWDIPAAEIDDAYNRAAEWLRVPASIVKPQSGADSPHGKLGRHFLRRHVFALPFRNRNFTARSRARLESDDGLVLLLNADVSSFATSSLDDTRKVISVQVDLNGLPLAITAAVFVICAGAIESTRLLLHAAGDHPTRLGEGFRDHVSLPAGKFHVRDRNAFLDCIAPRFEAGGIVHPRFELSAAAQAEYRLPAAFVHVVAISDGKTALDAIRRFLSILQKRQGGIGEFLREGLAMFAAAPDFARIVCWRAFRRKLYYPRGHDFVLQVDLEQPPAGVNRLYLGGPDEAGLGKCRIDWQLGQQDIDHANLAASLFAADWNSNSGKLAIVTPEPIELKICRESEAAFDVYHPVGSTAFGRDPAAFSVDTGMGVRGFSNLYTVSTGVLPSSGAANPTFTAIALALRLADTVLGPRCREARR